MSNEKLARQWAESRNPNSLSEDARAAREYILEHVALQRMDEVAWSDDEHALAGAVMDIGSGPVEVVMLSVDSYGYLAYATLDGKVAHGIRYEFTPNGKRYRLEESGPIARPYWVATMRDSDWEPVDADGMCREDYMEWKPWKWYAQEGESLTLEEAVEAVRLGAGYARPYRIMHGEDVFLEIPASPEAGDCA